MSIGYLRLLVKVYTIRIANSLDPDDTPRSVKNHMKIQNCLQNPSSEDMCRVLSTQSWQLMHVRKVSSHISICSSHRLIRDDTFRLNLKNFR